MSEQLSTEDAAVANDATTEEPSINAVPTPGDAQAPAAVEQNEPAAVEPNGPAADTRNEPEADAQKAPAEEQTATATDTATEADPNAGLSTIASYHFAAAMAALTLWGAGDAWASTTGLALAEFVSLANALIAGVVLAYLFHEWGHFTGARLAKSVSPVLEKPRSFFMFSFDMARNSTSQFLSMSVGGPAANWTLVLLLVVLIPVDTASRALLIATAAGIATSVSFFEVPVIQRVRAGGEPVAELTSRLASGALATGRYVSIGAGAVVMVVLAGAL
jgi:hypothetical protein